MKTGKVKWFNFTKGFGFIQSNDVDGDVFIHKTALDRAGISDLQEGQTVGFDLFTNDKGRTSATNVTLL